MLRALLFCLAVLLPQAAQAQNDITLVQLTSGLSFPVDIAHAGDNSGRLFVVQQGGRIRIVQNGTLLPTPFLDLTTAPSLVATGGERGLLGLAFHPQYATNGFFFVYFTGTMAAGVTHGDVVIARFQRSAGDPNLADPLSRTTVLTVPHSTYDNHNGGSLRFGPDGFLYAGVGDGGSGGDPFNAGQNLNTLLGKILRIDVNALPYSIPPTNPFAAGMGPGGVPARPEIWAYGVRNPWRFSFDRQTGDFWLGDVGQGDWEEVDFIAAGSAGGANFGWRILEGMHCYNPMTGCVNPPNYVPPVLEYDHGVGVSITGGYVYRGQSTPDLAGRYVFGDYNARKIFKAPGDMGAPFTQVPVINPRVSTFGEGETGELYVVDLLAGTLSSFSSSTDTTPDAAVFFPVPRAAPSTVQVSNPIRVTGLGSVTPVGIAVTGGEYSIGCNGTFTAVASTIANNATVCVRHTSAASDGGSVTTSLTIGTATWPFQSTTEILALQSVVSRRAHGPAGDADLVLDPSLPVTGTLPIEPRAGSARVVFAWNHPIVAPGTVTITDHLGMAAGSATTAADGNTVVVTLSGVADGRRVRVALAGVNGTTSAAVSLTLLAADVDGSGSVDAADLLRIRARSLLTPQEAGFEHDLNASGRVTAADIAGAKARQGNALP